MSRWLSQNHEKSSRAGVPARHLWWHRLSSLCFDISERVSYA